jgi:hypothetical protein
MLHFHDKQCCNFDPYSKFEVAPGFVQNFFLRKGCTQQCRTKDGPVRAQPKPRGWIHLHAYQRPHDPITRDSAAACRAGGPSKEPLLRSRPAHTPPAAPTPAGGGAVRGKARPTSSKRTRDRSGEEGMQGVPSEGESRVHIRWRGS